MQRKFSRELMRDFLKKEHDDDEQKITDIVGEFNWHWMVTGKRRSNRLLPKGPKKKDMTTNLVFQIKLPDKESDEKPMSSGFDDWIHEVFFC